MAGLWKRDSSGFWRPASSAKFDLEAHLEEAVFDTPSMLPLAGSPQITALRRQFPLANGALDIMAVEETGRPVLIEVKLGTNPESRRAIVAQLLSYAAFLEKMSLDEFTAKAATAGDASAIYARVLGLANPDEFNMKLQQHLEAGYFRLVLVLDSVPAALARLASYLQFATTQKLWIDLVELQAFDVSGERVIVPRLHELQPASEPAPGQAGQLTSVIREDGPELFLASVPFANPDAQMHLVAWTNWAKGLEAAGLTRLSSAKGSSRTVLTLRLPKYDGGLASVWNENGTPFVTVHNTVIAARAPHAHLLLEAVLGQESLAKRTTRLVPSEVVPDVLHLLSDGYVEAAADSS